MLQDAEAGRFGSVLVYRLTRLDRISKPSLTRMTSCRAFGSPSAPPRNPPTPARLSEHSCANCFPAFASWTGRQVLDQLDSWPGPCWPAWGSQPPRYRALWLHDRHRGTFLVLSTRFITNAQDMTKAEDRPEISRRVAAGSFEPWERPRGCECAQYPNGRAIIRNSKPREGFAVASRARGLSDRPVTIYQRSASLQVEPWRPSSAKYLPSPPGTVGTSKRPDSNATADCPRAMRSAHYLLRGLTRLWSADATATMSAN